MKKLCNFCKIPTKTISKTILKIHQWVIGFKLSKNIPIYVYEKKLTLIKSGVGSHVSRYFIPYVTDKFYSSHKHII